MGSEYFRQGSAMMKLPEPGQVESQALGDFAKVMQGGTSVAASRPAASLPGSTWTRTTSRTAWDNWS